jgi:hypothetical protein
MIFLELSHMNYALLTFYRQQNQDVQQMYSKEKGHKEGIMEDHKRSLQTLRKEMVRTL